MPLFNKGLHKFYSPSENVEPNKLKVNYKKTFITDSYNGFDFLGYRFRVINNKIRIDIKSENKKRRDKNIKKINYMYKSGSISYRRYFNSMSNYLNSYRDIK